MDTEVVAEEVAVVLAEVVVEEVDMEVHEVHPWVVEDTTKVAMVKEVGIKEEEVVAAAATAAGEDNSRIKEVGMMAMAVGVKAGETIPEEDSKTQIKADGEMTIMAKVEVEETTTDLPKIKAAEEATATTAKIKAAMEVDQEMVVRWEADTTKDTEVALCDNLEAETETHLMEVDLEAAVVTAAVLVVDVEVDEAEVEAEAAVEAVDTCNLQMTMI